MTHDEALPRYVYVTSAEFGPVKIGSSANPEKRRQHVRNGGPFLTVRATYFRPGDAMKIEFAAHKLLRDKRRGRSEWFNCTVAQAKWAIEQAIAAKDAAK
jgi:hypothetical protein